tara:strand:+ start:184 stop:393 length:210 start_codon:yes stop_codon:yes gene_type:complete
MIRDKFHNALKDFRDINLDSETARNALIDRIINIVQNESSHPKYWSINKAVESDTGLEGNSTDGWSFKK